MLNLQQALPPDRAIEAVGGPLLGDVKRLAVPCRQIALGRLVIKYFTSDSAGTQSSSHFHSLADV